MSKERLWPWRWKRWLDTRNRSPRPSRVLDEGSVNWGQLLDDVDEAVGTHVPTPVVETVIRALFETVAHHLDHGRQVHVRRWGKWFVRRVEAHDKEVPNPDGSRRVVRVPTEDVPYFTFGDHLRDLIARPGPEPEE